MLRRSPIHSHIPEEINVGGSPLTITISDDEGWKVVKRIIIIGGRRRRRSKGEDPDPEEGRFPLAADDKAATKDDQPSGASGTLDAVQVQRKTTLATDEAVFWIIMAPEQQGRGVAVCVDPAAELVSGPSALFALREGTVGRRRGVVVVVKGDRVVRRCPRDEEDVCRGKNIVQSCRSKVTEDRLTDFVGAVPSN